MSRPKLPAAPEWQGGSCCWMSGGGRNGEGEKNRVGEGKGDWRRRERKKRGGDGWEGRGSRELERVGEGEDLYWYHYGDRGWRDFTVVGLVQWIEVCRGKVAIIGFFVV